MKQQLSLTANARKVYKYLKTEPLDGPLLLINTENPQNLLARQDDHRALSISGWNCAAEEGAPNPST